MYAIMYEMLSCPLSSGFASTIGCYDVSFPRRDVTRRDRWQSVTVWPCTKLSLSYADVKHLWFVEIECTHALSWHKQTEKHTYRVDVDINSKPLGLREDKYMRQNKRYVCSSLWHELKEDMKSGRPSGDLGKEVSSSEANTSDTSYHYNMEFDVNMLTSNSMQSSIFCMIDTLHSEVRVMKRWSLHGIESKPWLLTMAFAKSFHHESQLLSIT